MLAGKECWWDAELIAVMMVRDAGWVGVLVGCTVYSCQDGEGCWLGRGVGGLHINSCHGGEGCWLGRGVGELNSCQDGKGRVFSYYDSHSIPHSSYSGEYHECRNHI